MQDASGEGRGGEHYGTQLPRVTKSLSQLKLRSTMLAILVGQGCFTGGVIDLKGADDR